jgi:peptidoglycan/xylan/chitin deacetylase (PgdA/CDA1 family)
MIRSLIKGVAASGPGWALTTGIVRRNGITVLMYHRVQGDDKAFQGSGIERFREQMQWLKRRCTVIHPDDFDQAVEQGRRIRPPVLATFDDGYRDYHDHVYPVLHELRIPAVVFLATRFIDAGGLIWTDAVNWAVFHSEKQELKLPWDEATVLDLNDASARSACAGSCKAFLKNIPDFERNHWQSRLFAALDIDPFDGKAGRQMLNWDEVRATMEYTVFGGHTHTHPILCQVDRETAETEIRRCRDRIHEETGVAPRYFAYPNGKAQDFTDDTKAILRRYGFTLAFSTIEGIHEPDMDPLAIRRQPTGARSIGDFAWLVAGR